MDLGFTYLFIYLKQNILPLVLKNGCVIYCLLKMVVKSKHFEMEEVDQDDAYYSEGSYVTSSYFLLYNNFACVLTLVLILQGFCQKGAQKGHNHEDGGSKQHGHGNVGPHDSFPISQPCQFLYMAHIVVALLFMLTPSSEATPSISQRNRTKGVVVRGGHNKIHVGLLCNLFV